MVMTPTEENELLDVMGQQSAKIAELTDGIKEAKEATEIERGSYQGQKEITARLQSTIQKLESADNPPDECERLRAIMVYCAVVIAGLKVNSAKGQKSVREVCRELVRLMDGARVHGGDIGEHEFNRAKEDLVKAATPPPPPKKAQAPKLPV